MVEGQIKGMHLFCITFPDSLPINNTTALKPTYLEVTLGNIKYHHHDGGTPNTEITLNLLYYG
jgi:hypothetical protein